MRLFPANQREGSGEAAPRRGLLFPLRVARDGVGWAISKLPLPPRSGDRIFRGASLGAALLLIVLVALIVLTLAQSSWPAWAAAGGSLLTSAVWLPDQGSYGAFPLIEGTLITSGIALLIAVPVSLGIAVFLAELAPAWLRAPISVIVELLAAIPSVVFGLWGIFVLGPVLRDTLFPRLQSNWGWTGLFGGNASGVSVLTAGVLLAIMIIPTISSLSREVMRAVPVAQREAAFALGATRWEVIRLSVLPNGRRGLFAAAILGLARALGETMAVIMVIGNNPSPITSLLGLGATIPSTIAGSAGDSSGTKLAGLFALGLILFVVSVGVNGGARVLMNRPFRRSKGAAA